MRRVATPAALALAAIPAASASAPAAAAATCLPLTIVVLGSSDLSTLVFGTGDSPISFIGAGTFTASGPVSGSGPFTEQTVYAGWIAPRTNTAHDLVTLTFPDGTLTLDYQALHDFVSGRFEGHWVAGGTGVYASLSGEGAVSIDVVGEGTDNPIVTETFTGCVR